jgi:uncharacterized membrane protein
MSQRNEIVRADRLPLRLSAPENDRLAVHIVYALYAAAILFGVPSVLGVLLAYLKREDVAGTDLEGHIGWQIRTFWIWLVFWVVGTVCVASVLLIPVGWLLLGFGHLWFVYRVVKGWIVHSNENSLGNPRGFW